MAKPLRALLVDVGNTLVDFTPLKFEIYREIISERLALTFGGVLPWFAGLPQHLLGGPPEWRQDNRAVVGSWLAAYDLPLTDHAYDRIRQSCDLPLSDLLARELVAIDAATVAAVQEARALGLKLAVCSNTPWQGALEWERDHPVLGIGDCIQGYVSSFDFGFAKPNPAIFEAAMALLGVSPDETAMVGDDLACDIGGAQALGMRTIWKRTPGAPASYDGTRPDAVIDDGSQLMGVLRSWL